ncbi:threonine ammonia-lyase [Algihabitans albus]|uniref:threonine ammonia-lyase n=1 Tax=Algihabitans albus TaxID=2164067 RepID=UPI000E5D5DD4|nr:threonine/serine dehydratase [Algihabitans albus]
MSSLPQSTPQPPEAVTVADLEAARRRIAAEAVTTPLLAAPELSTRLGYRILLKCENLQRTGSFKFRGAYNFLASMTPEQRARGVVAFSSGNHAQGVAAAAQIFGTPATIVMPADAPAIKIANTRGYGAEVLLYDRYREEREAIGERLVAERGRTLVRPYDDPKVIAGQGTCGLELLEQAAARDLRPDRVLVCCGGGGLTAGIALALEALSPRTRLYTCEPEGFDDTARSLAAGRRLANEAGGRSICDALLAAMPGEVTFPINTRRVTAGLTVTDGEVERAMSYAFRRLKLVVEPGGAVCLAALLAGKLDIDAGETICITLSGGNVDPARLAAALESEPDA